MAKMAFSEQAWQEYLYWQLQDKKTLKRVNQLLKDIERSHFEGLGKPEALKGNLSGFWSRRIDDGNRLIYRINGEFIDILPLRDCLFPIMVSLERRNKYDIIRMYWKMFSLLL